MEMEMNSVRASTHSAEILFSEEESLGICHAHSQTNQHTHPQSFNKAHYIIQHDKCFGLTGSRG